MSKEQLGGLDPQAIADTLLAAANAAANETLPRFRTALAVDNKYVVGFDPVTDGDREAERVIRETITARLPFRPSLPFVIPVPAISFDARCLSVGA